MNVVDNFDLLAKALFPEDGKCPEGEFYFVQILVRGKDGNHVNGNNKNRLVRYYVVRSAEKLQEIKQEVHQLCLMHNARAYIHPTPRNDKEVAAIMLEDAVHEYTVGNYHCFRKLYSTACGKSFMKDKKLYIVDLDPEQLEHPALGAGLGINPVETVRYLLHVCRGQGGPNFPKVVVDVPTKHGVHLVTVPFDIGQFTKYFEEKGVKVPDIHKNNPTLLFAMKD